jgi:tetratricopeptide (TPR) repeat protein
LATEYKYRAFISYSHKDEKWASWLHRALETFRVPKNIVGETTPMGTVPERLGKVFRDREELASSTSLGEELTQALEDPACQIVICSPNAAGSHWTNEEILTYKRLGREDRVFSLIVDGEPNASQFEETAEFECFPEALRFRMGADGNLTKQRSEPIAADARPQGDGKQNAKLKLIAGMLGVGFDALKQREQQRRQKRMALFTAAATVGMIITSGLATLAVIARNEAEYQRTQAEIEAETARQTTQFMVGLFEVSDPSESLGNSITAREILDKGAERIETELQDQPEIQATLMETMGTVYTSLGLYEPAVSLVGQALEKRTALYGSSHAEVAQSLYHLGEVQTRKADYDDAERNLREALAVRRDLLGSETPEVAETLSQLANVLTEKGDYPAAEPLIRESLEIRRAVFDESHPEVADGLEDLGLNLFDQGDFQRSVPLLREAVAMRRERQGELHPDLAEAISNLAFVLSEAGTLEEAESLWKEALSMMRRLYGDEHPEIAAALGNVAWVLDAQRNYDAAEPIYNEMIAMQKKLLGERHPTVGVLINNLAYLQYDMGNRSKAMALARESLEIKREAFGDVHPEIAVSLYTIALWTMDSGDYGTAEVMLRESLAMNIELLGREHASTANSIALLANCLVASGKYEEALDLAVEARAIYTAAYSENHWRTAVAIGVHGAALAGQGSYSQAEPLLLRSHSVLSQDPNALPRYVNEATRRLASLYSEWGKPEQAAEFLALAEE